MHPAVQIFIFRRRVDAIDVVWLRNELIHFAERPLHAFKPFFGFQPCGRGVSVRETCLTQLLHPQFFQIRLLLRGAVVDLLAVHRECLRFDDGQNFAVARPKRQFRQIGLRLFCQTIDFATIWNGECNGYVTRFFQASVHDEQIMAEIVFRFRHEELVAIDFDRRVKIMGTARVHDRRHDRHDKLAERGDFVICRIAVAPWIDEREIELLTADAAEEAY